VGCGQVSASLYFFSSNSFSFYYLFSVLNSSLCLLFCFAGFELAIHLKDFEFEILIKCEYDTTDPKHNTNQISICELAHKMIDTTLVF
jgi:hypothetical protein